MPTMLDILGPDARQSRIKNGRKRKLTPDEVLSITALVDLGERQYDVARRFGVSECMVYQIVHGWRWGSVTGRKPASEKMTGRHAAALIDEIAKRPDDAPRLREMFDSKFGEGAALRSVRALMTAGAR